MFRIILVRDDCPASSDTDYKGYRSTLWHSAGIRCICLSFRRQTTQDGWSSLSGMYALPGIRTAAQAGKQSHIPVNSLQPTFRLMWSEDSMSTAEEKDPWLSSVVPCRFKATERFVTRKGCEVRTFFLQILSAFTTMGPDNGAGISGCFIAEFLSRLLTDTPTVLYCTVLRHLL
jgi:hypothetical protein